MPSIDYVEPTSVDEACRLLRDDPDGSMPLAGGTAVVLMLRFGLIAPERLVSLARLSELDGIEVDDGTVRIGAGVPINRVARSTAVRDRLPSLAAACDSVGNIRVRNVATLGGNLAEADYASDPPAVLSSLGAVCRVRGADGARDVPVAELVTGFYETALHDGEIITDVVVPTHPGRRSVYLKYVSRSSEDRPCVGVAARVDHDGGQVTDLDVVVGAVAATPQRVPDALGAAVGRPLDDAAVTQVASAYADAIEPMDDARGSAWYRTQMIEVFVRRALSRLRDDVGRAEGDADG